MNCTVSSRSLPSSGNHPLQAKRPLAAWTLAAWLAASLIVGWGSPAGAATYYVDRSSATCSNTGAGTEAQPYCTITAALAARGVAGNTIMVKPGIYQEQVSIPASGVAGSPIIVQAFAPGVVIDGSDAFTNAAQWTLLSGNVWLASTVTWNPRQVFLDGARIDSSIVAPASLASRTFRWVSGQGLYVNAGGGNPATHQAQIGRRNFGFTLPARSFVVIDGFTVTRTEDRGINLSATCNNVTLTHNTVTFTNKMGIQIVGGTGHVVGSNIVHDCNDHGIAFITGVNNTTIEDNESYRNARPIDRVANGIYLFGCPTNTIRRNKVHDNEDTGIHIQSGSNNCIQYLNRSWNNGDHGFDHLQCTGTIHNGDVAYGNFRDGFSIEGSATGTQVHNCIAVNNGLTTNEFDLWVDGTSTTGFVSNYNIFWNSTTQPPVKYIATVYPTVSAYATANAHDQQSLQANPLFVSPASGNFHIGSGSPAIDNANSGAPNWPTLDADNLARFNASGVPNTGIGPINYGDRGAYEFRGTSTNQAPNGVINTPTANVTIIAGQTVSFTGTGTDSDNNLPLTFAWNFGGGATNSIAEDPGAVVFSTAGTYTVSFTVTDALGLADPTPATRTITVTANQAPNGTISTPTGNVTIVAGQSLNFTGTGTDPNNNLPLTYSWNFGGGATNSTLQNPGAVVFNTAGTFTVTFTVVDALGLPDPTPDTRTITVTAPANQAPNGTISTPTANVTIIAGQSVNFTGAGTDPNNNLPLTYLWNFGGGATNSTLQNPGAVVFSTAGTFTVSFTVTDALGLADPTPDTRTITVTANQAPNGTISTPTGNVTIAAGQSVNFTGAGTDPNNNLPLTYLWNFGGGATNSTLQNPGAVVFSAPGTFTVAFTVTDAIGLADPTPDTRTITVTGTNQAPNGTISTPTGNVTIAAGQSVNFTGTGTDPNNNLPLTYLWNFGGGATGSTLQNPGAVVFNTAGTFTVTFTVTDALALADPTPDTRTITVNPSTPGPCANNLVTNPSFEGGIAGWKGVGATLAQVPGGSAGSFSCRVTGGASTASFYVEDSPRSITGPVAGTPYSFAAKVRSDAGTGSARIRVIEYLNGARVGQLDSPPVTLSPNWQPLQVDYTATQTGSVIYFTVRDQPVAASEAFDVDELSVCSGASPPPNQAPNGVIDTPTANVTIAAGQSVSFTGTGTDPDNNLPLTFAWNFGGGAPNSTVEDPGAVVFTAPGTFTVSFTVTDAKGLADPTPATRVVTVTGTNQAPNGVIDTPTANVTIPAGQSVSFTGTGTDPNGNLPLTFAWNFGGGAANSTVEDPGAVVFNTAGTFTVTFTVTDALALADPTPDTRTITVTAPPGPCVNLVTNPSFEGGIAGWKGVGATLAQVPGGSAGSFSCRVTGGASTSSFYIEDSPRSITGPVAGTLYHLAAKVRSDVGTGSARIRVIEYLNGVRVGQIDSAPVTLSPTWQPLQVDYTATSTGSVIYFTVKDQPVAVSEAFDVDELSVCPGPIALAPAALAAAIEAETLEAGAPAFLAPSVRPNPVGRQAMLSFSTSRSGPLQVSVFDVSGRRVRMLLDDPNSQSGIHFVPLDDRGDDGARLGSGIYFYRIRSADGLKGGRFLIMK